MLTRLLVPLDGSATAQMALVYAAAIPSESLRLLTVLPGGAPIERTPSSPAGDDWRSAWQSRVIASLEEAAAQLREHNRVVNTDVMFGEPAESILESAQDSDFVIMTTHGHGAGRRLLFGSVADRVARSSEVPVMLIRGGDDPITAQPIVRLVVALDGSNLAEQSLEITVQLATSLGIPVLLVRVVDLSSWMQVAQLNVSASAKYASSRGAILSTVGDYLEEQAELLRPSGVQVETAVLEGHAPQEINKLLMPGDVLVLTSHGRSGIRRWMLGSVAEKLIVHGKTPVVVVRAKHIPES